MQRRHFEIIAGALAASRPNRRAFPCDTRFDGAMDAWRFTVLMMRNHLATANPRFDEGRFLRAAGFAS